MKKIILTVILTIGAFIACNESSESNNEYEDTVIVDSVYRDTIAIDVDSIEIEDDLEN